MNFSVKGNLISIENPVTGDYAIVDIIARTLVYNNDTYPLLDNINYKQDRYINDIIDTFPNLFQAYKVRIADDNQIGLIENYKNMYCVDCDISSGYFISNNGTDWYCPAHFIEKEFIVCSNCGKEIDNGEETTIDGATYCGDCRDELYSYCEDCDTYHSSDDMYCVNSGTRSETYVCSDCVRRYYQCIDCGDYFTDDHVYTNNDTSVCHNCRDNGSWYICDECGEIVSESNIQSNDDGYYCSDCFQGCAGTIRDHGYKPAPEFHGEGPLYLGIELECDKGNERNSIAHDLLTRYSQEESLFYIKQDGSLDCGYEIVTHPFSYDEIINHKSLFKSIMDDSIKAGFKSHDAGTCGLHIHVSRKGLGDTIDQQDDTIAKIIYLYEKEFASFLKFSRRTEQQLRQWANRYCDDTRITTLTAKDVYETAKGTSDRYRAINLENRHTIEFRFFRGTLNIDTFIASVQLINNMIGLCINTTLDSIEFVTFANIIGYSEQSELTIYSNKRGL